MIRVIAILFMSLILNCSDGKQIGLNQTNEKSVDKNSASSGGADGGNTSEQGQTSMDVTNFGEGLDSESDSEGSNSSDDKSLGDLNSGDEIGDELGADHQSTGSEDELGNKQIRETDSEGSNDTIGAKIGMENSGENNLQVSTSDGETTSQMEPVEVTFSLVDEKTISGNSESQCEQISCPAGYVATGWGGHVTNSDLVACRLKCKKIKASNSKPVDLHHFSEVKGSSENACEMRQCPNSKAVIKWGGHVTNSDFVRCNTGCSEPKLGNLSLKLGDEKTKSGNSEAQCDLQKCPAGTVLVGNGGHISSNDFVRCKIKCRALLPLQITNP